MDDQGLYTVDPIPLLITAHLPNNNLHPYHHHFSVKIMFIIKFHFHEYSTTVLLYFITNVTRFMFDFLSVMLYLGAKIAQFLARSPAGLVVI